MRYASLLIAFIIMTMACRKVTHYNNPTVWTKEFWTRQGLHIDTAIIPSIPDQVFHVEQGGNNTVFFFQYGYGMYDPVYNNEISSNLIFQADSGVTSFSYKGKEMKQHQTYYWGKPYMLVDSGFIIGNLLPDGRWNVYFDVYLPQVDQNCNMQHFAEQAIYESR